jgi:hypothetical protein
LFIGSHGEKKEWKCRGKAGSVKAQREGLSPSHAWMDTGILILICQG